MAAGCINPVYIPCSLSNFFLSLCTCMYLLSICSVSYLVFLLWYTAVSSSLLDRHQFPRRRSESSLRKVSMKSFKVRKVYVETLQVPFQWKVLQLRQHTILTSWKLMMQYGTWLKSTWRWFPTENPTTPIRNPTSCRLKILILMLSNYSHKLRNIIRIRTVFL